MGLTSWCHNRWLMMMRTKPQYISSLGRKRSSLRSSPKLSSHEGIKINKKFSYFLCVVIMCCSMTYGMLLVLFQNAGSATTSTFILSLFIAGLASITGGLCLAEFISEQSQEVHSIYSCCYQYCSEVLAFFVGWTWLISQTATVAAICKLSAIYINQWTDDIIRNFLKNTFSSYADAVPSLFFALAFTLFILTGLSETIVWYVTLMPLTFLLAGAAGVLECLMDFQKWTIDSKDLGWKHIQGVDQILTSAALCMLFFSGPQSMVRLPQTRVRKNTNVILGPLNALCLLTVFIFTIVACQYVKFFDVTAPPNSTVALVANILRMVCLCSLGIDALYPLHFVVEDMAADGLLFRSLSKKWKPFCFQVASPFVQLLTVVGVGVISLLLPLGDILNLVVMFPLLVNSMVPFLVLMQRYRDNNSWQYEPMFHTSAKRLPQDRSRKKSHEFQYTNTAGFDVTEGFEMSTTCAEENLSSDSSSDTDVDAVVKQYKDQARVANMKNLDDSDLPTQIQEPTPSSAIRAKFAIAGLLAISVIISITLNFADPEDHFSVIVIVLLCMLFSTSIQGLLLCLPQNQDQSSRGCCSHVPSMPWGPGVASLISSTLLVHCLLQTWKVCLGWFLLGFLVYFIYGIRSSTAASSFYHLRPAHITLRPLPSYGNNCIPQIVPSQRKTTKSRKQRRVRSGHL